MTEAIQSTGKAANASAFAQAQMFLSREARLLDERRFREWFSLLDDAIEYSAPIREARIAFEDEVPPGAFRILDNRDLIEVRIKRNESGAAWAETPPSRTLRLVGSLIVEETNQVDVIAVESALIVYRQRGHDERGDIIPVRRKDLLRLTANGPRLLKRTALLTEAVLNTPNLGVFL
jgi:3-phenylpropionate/cinnamic acid dioxygenase small subunit